MMAKKYLIFTGEKIDEETGTIKNQTNISDEDYIHENYTTVNDTFNYY